MSWKDIARVPLRVLLNDIDSEVYTDEKLDQLMVVAAGQVLYDIKISNQYVVSYADFSVTPDPSSDTAFINFIILKAACLKQGWEFDIKMKTTGVKAVIGPAHINVSSPGVGALLGILNEGVCKTYEQMKKEYNAGRIGNIRAILSPFTNEDVNFYG